MDPICHIYIVFVDANIKLIRKVKLLQMRECSAKKHLRWVTNEVKILTTLALPQAILFFTEGLQLKISNVFIGRSSGDNVTLMLSALFLGQVITNCTAFPISQGLSICVNILCSQAHGAKQHRLVGLYFYRAICMAILTIFPISALFISVRPMVYMISKDWELASNAGSYTSIFCFGYPAYVYYKTAIRFLQAQNIVWPPLIYLTLGNILNGVLQYIFIFHYNAGIAGAAAGYVVSMYLDALLIFAHIRFTQTVASVNWNVEMIREWYHTTKYSISATIQTLASTIMTNFIPYIILGIIAKNRTQLTIFSILYSIWFVLSLFSMGYASAITVRIGNILGANDPAEAKKTAIFGIIYGGICILTTSGLLFAVSEPLGNLFTTDILLRRNLAFSIKILSVTILGDFMFLEQGIMNACCMQQIDAILKIVFRIVLGSVLSFIITNYVEWKALCLLCIQSLMCILCLIFGLVVIFSKNWRYFALKVSKNTGNSQRVKTQDRNYPKLLSTLYNGKLLNSEVFLVSRYCSCLLFGALIFVIAYVYN